MPGGAFAPLRPLVERWRIRVVVTPGTLDGLAGTLADLRDHALTHEIELLAPDVAGLRDALAGWGLPVACTLPVDLSPGRYWCGLLGAAPPGEVPCIYLQAGVRVPRHFDARLVAASQRAGNACAVAPLSARHPLLSLFTDPRHNPGLTADELDQWLNDYAPGVEFPVPVLAPACLLIRGEAGVADETADDLALAVELRGRGQSVVATPQVYVDDAGLSGDEDLSRLPTAYLDAYRQRSPLGGIRHALTELSRRGEAPPELRDCRPVQLHVGHSWGGGLGRWMEDFVAADDAHHHLVLRSIGELSAFGQTIALYRSTAMDTPLQSWTLSEPVVSISPGSVEYRRILSELVVDYGVESLVISSLIGHSLDLLRTALPTTVVLHDYFPFCPALYATFDKPCQSCDADRLRRCGRENPRHSYFRHEDDSHWLAIRAEYARLLAAPEIAVAAPSQSVVDRYLALEPALSGRPVAVIPHGLDAALAASLAPDPAAVATEGGRLRVVVLGRLTAEKGGDVLRRACGQLAEFAELHLLGTGESGDAFRNLPGVQVVPAYERDELGELLRRIDPHAGLLLSTVPETFSYTLSELHAAAVPVLATPVGALGERVVPGGNGWFVDADPDAVVAALRGLDTDRSQLAQVRDNLLQDEVGTTTAMARAYAALEPAPGCVPLQRYYLPRRSWRNPYGDAAETAAGAALLVNPQLPYRRALAEFMRYTARKTEQTPSLPAGLRRILGGLLRRLSGGGS